MSQKLTPIRRRLISSSAALADGTPEEIIYQHTVCCQTCLPYRNPGDTVRRWEKQQGNVHLLVNAGEVLHPKKNRYVELGLPYGAKPRLVLMHLNDRAIKTQSPMIEVEDSLTAFAKNVLGYAPNGDQRLWCINIRNPLNLLHFSI
jgi:hypothetical protein